MDDSTLRSPNKKGWLARLLRASLAPEYLSPITTTVVNAAGWLTVYVLVLSPQAEQSKSQARLFDAQLQKLQSANQMLNDQISLMRNKMQSATELMAAREAIRPRVQFSQFKFVFSPKDTVAMEQEVKNLGLYPVVIEAPSIRLSLTPETSSANLLSEGRDYEVFGVSRPGTFFPGEDINEGFSIKVKAKKLMGVTIYYEIGWDIASDPKVIEATRNALGDQITDAEIVGLSKFHLNLTDTIIFQK